MDSHGKDSSANNSSLRCFRRNTNCSPTDVTSPHPLYHASLDGRASEHLKHQRPPGIISIHPGLWKLQWLACLCHLSILLVLVFPFNYLSCLHLTVWQHPWNHRSHMSLMCYFSYILIYKITQYIKCFFLNSTIGIQDNFRPLWSSFFFLILKIRIL